MAKNAYFQLNESEKGVYLSFFPPEELGESLQFAEVDEYLMSKHLDYDKKQLIDILQNLKSNAAMLLPVNQILPEQECVRIIINSERTLAVGRFYPPSKRGSFMTKDEVINDLVRTGIKYGVCQDAIDDFFYNRCYCTDYVLAKATLPIEGSHAKITYKFNSDLTKKPKTNEDGSVNFHELDNICHVQKGQLLATLEPAVQGRPGIDVCGNILRPQPVRVKKLKHANKIKLSEDGLQMFSEVDGHVSLIDDKVFVSDSFEVSGDIDASTGDIRYDGNVLIHGNVLTGYNVTAHGDIVVDGVVEGAVLDAGGQIILKRGIQGMNKGLLKAKSNIISKFIENATILSGGYITTEAIMHSKVTAKGDIVVGGKRGSITGGEIKSGTMIAAKTAGSTMGTYTLLEVGADSKIATEYQYLERELPATENEILKINQILSTYAKKIKAGEKISRDKVSYLKTVSEEKNNLQKRITEMETRLQLLQNHIDSLKDGYLKIDNIIYPGCKIMISNVVYFVRSELKHCRLIREHADIRIDAY